MIRFEDIYETVARHHPQGDLDLVRKAYVFSAMEHKGQTRASGEPYLVHPLEVAALLAGMRMDPACVAVGLLHDVLEDTLTTPERLSAYFGTEVLRLVEGVTKLSKISFSSSEERQAENFRKLLLAMAGDLRVVVVKLADRLHNMRTLQHLAPDRQVRIARETMDIYAPLASRMGMSRVKNELEDWAFQYLEPEAYRDLAARVEERRKQAQVFIERIKAALAEKLRAAGIEAHLQGRIKRLYSIYQKLRRQQIDLDRVYDFVALRVLVDSEPACYAALGILHGAWRPVPGRIKDFIAMPRPNGYQSLHTSVIADEGQPFEIQIRTHEMHRVAEEGLAAHWRYKQGVTESDKYDERLQWLRRLVEWEGEVTDPHEFLEGLKKGLYEDEVYCFTPKGELKTLPRDATPLDFAYLVHTEVGHRCAGARVNGKLVTLRTRLRNGDIVEILTSPDHQPSRDALAFVATNRARSKIRHYLNATAKQQAIEIGRRQFEREARRHERSLKKLLADAAHVLAVAEDFGVGTQFDDLLAAIGYGKLSSRQVLARLDPEASLAASPAAEAAPEPGVAPKVTRVSRSGEGGLKVKGTDDLLIFRARCCNPIMGEPIVGYITRGKGVSVHSQACPNVVKLHDPERRIAVEWEHNDAATFEVLLALDVEDRPGMLAAATAALASAGTDIRDVDVRMFADRTATLLFRLAVEDRRHLDRVMRALRGVAGVSGVERQVGATPAERGRDERIARPEGV
jgi:GTP pyrophosphokinase